MNYPLISEYIESIKLAENNLSSLSHLRPVLGVDGVPVMTSGNFAVVFKMKDGQTGKFYFDTKTREYNGKYYTDINCWKWEVQGAQNTAPSVPGAPF